MRDRNIVTEPNFRKSLSKSRILPPKSYLSIGKQNAVPVSLEAGGGIPCRPNSGATLLVFIGVCLRECVCVCVSECLFVNATITLEPCEAQL